jgi:hypothetical protein
MVASTVLQGSGHPCGSTRLVTAKAAARKIDIQFFYRPKIFQMSLVLWDLLLSSCSNLIMIKYLFLATVLPNLLDAILASTQTQHSTRKLKNQTGCPRVHSTFFVEGVNCLSGTVLPMCFEFERSKRRNQYCSVMQ